LVITAVITAAWAVALVVMLIVRDKLAPADRWWFWVPVAGLCLGLFGLVYVPYLKRSRALAAERRTEKFARQPDFQVGKGSRPGAAGQDADER
jgi:hypothetical protein